VDDEAVQREAERKAAALFHLGFENGAGAEIWARVVRDELDRHETARGGFASGRATDGTRGIASTAPRSSSSSRSTRCSPSSAASGA
jgi:hypothetical protein